MIFTVEEWIEASAQEVWQHLAEPAAMSAWMSGIDDMRTADGGPVTEGSELLFVARGKERTSRVVEFHAAEALTLRSAQGPITATYRYRLRPDGAGCRATLEAECAATGWGRIMVPLIAPLIRRTDGGQMQALKQVVEASRT